MKKQNNNAPHHEHVRAPDGFVSVRARRGQATDSHSLAERVHKYTHYSIHPLVYTKSTTTADWFAYGFN